MLINSDTLAGLNKTSVELKGGGGAAVGESGAVSQ